MFMLKGVVIQQSPETSPLFLSIISDWAVSDPELTCVPEGTRASIDHS